MDVLGFLGCYRFFPTLPVGVVRFLSAAFFSSSPPSPLLFSSRYWRLRNPQVLLEYPFSKNRSFSDFIFFFGPKAILGPQRCFERNQWLFNIVQRKCSETNGFSTFVSENVVKPVVFNVFRRTCSKTTGFSTFVSENAVKPVVFNVFRRTCSKTNGFSTFFAEHAVKPVVFQRFSAKMR